MNRVYKYTSLSIMLWICLFILEEMICFKIVDFLREMCYNICRKKKARQEFLRPGEHERERKGQIKDCIYKCAKVFDFSQKRVYNICVERNVNETKKKVSKIVDFFKKVCYNICVKKKQIKFLLKERGN